MGRYVAAGIACKISICKKDYISKEEFTSLKKEIKQEVEKYIDVKTYDVIEKDGSFCYMIKEDFVNEHFHELLKEINPILNIKGHFLWKIYRDDYKKIDVNSENFNSDEYNFKLEYFDKNYKFSSEYDKRQFINNYGILEGENIYSLDSPFFTENLWMIYGNRKLLESINIYTDNSLLWLDFNKIDGESELYVIRLLNIFARRYYKSPLSKNLHFYITG